MCPRLRGGGDGLYLGILPIDTNDLEGADAALSQ